jgi:hypothetical protein
MDRTKAVLRALIQYGKDRDRWPDLDRLHAFRKRLGCRATVYRTLCKLRELELAELRGASHVARWAPTPAGFDVLGKLPFEPALERQAAHAAAAALLDPPSLPAIRIRATVVPLGRIARSSDDLTLAE